MKPSWKSHGFDLIYLEYANNECVDIHTVQGSGTDTMELQSGSKDQRCVNSVVGVNSRLRVLEEPPIWGGGI